jgi:hypothetical protein
MKLLAPYFNWRARKCDDAGRKHEAIAYYRKAIANDPDWSVPRYNLGLLHKYRGEWADSYAHNSEALRLTPNDEATIWNTGIAATALGLWDEARAAWSSYGIDIPTGSGPIELDLGSIPVRINPDANGEVVWCRRIDPARAIILSIPLPESGRGYGDLLLHDGAAVGYRMLGEHQVPVFNELELLTRSQFATFGLELKVDSKGDLEDFERECAAATCFAEDWSTNMRIICRDCSEGRPHEHGPENRPSDMPNEGPHQFGIAADSRKAVERAVSEWLSNHPQCSAGELKVLLSPEDRVGASIG